MPRFTPEYLDEIKSRLKPSEVIGRKVKLKRRGDTWWGLSPFKEEKTPSFTVSDRRGSYHCFATQKHGNIIDFLMETERLTFPEAVERLAREAGLDLPENDPGAAERHRRKKGLIEACEAAAAYYEAMLRRAPGRAAAEYLKGRGVGDDLIREFRLGYAPDAGLRDHLINKGFTEDILIDAGLLAKSEDGRESYERFRNRVMFPILGSKDEVIAFGGRALDREARAKYLNSPETALFHKGDVLYNLGKARAAAAAKKKPLIVCEGYMDVIALFGAKFECAVAPLGTALGETQLAMLWRQCDEPVLCFDGDSAGIAAAYRSLDRALPMLTPGKSLRYVFLPDGQDPDDVVRNGGAPAFQQALDAALPLADVLWRRETERDVATPEQRAALKSGLRALVQTIADRDVRKAYGDEIGRRLDEFFARPSAAGGSFRKGAPERAGAGGRRFGRGRYVEPPPRPSSRLLRQKQPSSFAREATLVLVLINHPGLVERQEQAVMSLSLENAQLSDLMRAVLATLLEEPGLDSEGLKRHLQVTGAAKALERVLGDETLNRQTFLRADAELDEVERGWSDALRHHLIATEARMAMSESAAQSFTSGEESWKAAVNRREELIHAKAAETGTADADMSSEELKDRLLRMKASVGAKRRPR